MKKIGKDKIFVIVGTALIAVLIVVLFYVRALRTDISADDEDYIAELDNMTPEEVSEMHREEMIDELISEFEHFGIISTSGYINLRSEPDELDMTNIVGKLLNGAAVDILEEENGWSQVNSGGISGYCKSEYILTGDEARELAGEDADMRVIITTDVLNIRSEADSSDPENVIMKAREGERYVLLSRVGDWAKIETQTVTGTDTEGYINIADGNAEISFCLNTARRLDLRNMAATQYDHLVLAVSEGYVNIREDPSGEGIDNICGKFEQGSGGELLDTVSDSEGHTWYYIKSGDVKGYVRADYCLSGAEAVAKAPDYARLTAYINVDSLNVRGEPSLDANVWTSVTKNQAYDVLDQLDGWVEIGLDSGDSEDSDRAFISTRDNNVEVRYGLSEALEYYPAIEAANAAAAFRNSIVNFAVSYVGGRYVWGGTTLGVGVDCSGFVMRVFEHFGISLPRVSRDQAKCGVKVTSANMKPGDLVFYANSSGTINHVAIYIGNGQVISAASTKSGIKIASWNYRTPVAIRNVIGS